MITTARKRKERYDEERRKLTMDEREIYFAERREWSSMDNVEKKRRYKIER